MPVEKLLDQNLTILVVDDSPDTAESMAEVLSITGFLVTAVTSGRAAMKVAASSAPDVVLIDLRMPDMDGLELARQLRRITVPNRPLMIAVTGCAMQEDRARSAAAGIDLHLVKPVDLSLLVETLRRFATTTAQPSVLTELPWSPRTELPRLRGPRK